LFQLHSPPAAILEAGAYLETLSRMKAEGKIRYYGVACVETADAELCLGQAGMSAIQIQVNCLTYESASGVLERAFQRDIAVVARQPLAAGFLAKPICGLEPSQFSIPRSQYDRLYAKAALCQSLATPDRTIARGAIQFALQARGVSLVLPGMSSRRHLEENLRALEASALTEAEIENLTKRFAMAAR